MTGVGASKTSIFLKVRVYRSESINRTKERKRESIITKIETINNSPFRIPYFFREVKNITHIRMIVEKLMRRKISKEERETSGNSTPCSWKNLERYEKIKF